MRPRSPLAAARSHGDRRYRSARWLRLRSRVLKVVAGVPTAVCTLYDTDPHPATVAHHDPPVYDGMPDAEFYDEAHVFPACQHHNKAEGFLRAGGTPAERPGRRSIFRSRPRVG